MGSRRWWLKRIDVAEHYVGGFQTGHYMYEWADRPHEFVTAMRVRARVTDPAPGATIPAGAYTVRGKAWSGTGPITQVHVSLTGEGDWHEARLAPSQGPYQWQDWSFHWEANAPGRHTLRARATDAAGNVQPDVPPWNRIGYGNNAIEVSYGEIALFQLVGRMFISGGMTKKIAANAAMPPAVLRTIAPSTSVSTAMTVR